MPTTRMKMTTRRMTRTMRPEQSSSRYLNTSIFSPAGQRRAPQPDRAAGRGILGPHDWHRRVKWPGAIGPGRFCKRRTCRKSPYLPVAFCLDLPSARRYYPRTLRQAVSFQGSERITPSLAEFVGKLMRAPTSTNVAQTLSIKAGTAKRFSVSREIAGLSSGT